MTGESLMLAHGADLRDCGGADPGGVQMLGIGLLASSRCRHFHTPGIARRIAVERMCG